METRNLTNCILWKQPEAGLAQGLSAQFELLETYVKESHWWRYLLKCRDCGQCYVYEFYEEIDWQGGKDSQLKTWVPVHTADETAAIATAAAGQLGGFAPRLCQIWPKGENKSRLYWVK